MKEKKENRMFCTKCGNKLEEGMKYCPKCGHLNTKRKNKKPMIIAGISVGAILLIIVTFCFIWFNEKNNKMNEDEYDVSESKDYDNTGTNEVDEDSTEQEETEEISSDELETKEELESSSTEESQSETETVDTATSNYKEKYVTLLEKFMNGEEGWYLGDGLEATQYSDFGNCFALVDLNNDGQDELIVAPYQNDNGTLYYGNVFIPGDDWNSCLVGYVSAIDTKTGLCQYESGDIGGTLYIQKFDGKEFQTIDEYNYDYLWIDGDPTDQMTVIHKKADGSEEESTEKEMNSAKIQDNIKAYKLTKENIKKYIQ